jgi:phosphonopyruvate decarboxylase
MIDPSEFVEFLKDQGIDTFYGVPDSLLKDLSTVLHKDLAVQNVISANEGAALSQAIGTYMATGKTSAVYLQNSGLGNLINPLLSLADSEVFGIPMLIVMGWRGEPGKKDEPQHFKQGRVMLDLIEAMGYKYEILPESFPDARILISNLINDSNSNLQPVFLVVKAKTFFQIAAKQELGSSEFEMTREESLEIVLSNISSSSAVFSSTGMLSRELYEIRKSKFKSIRTDFLCIGGMGHVSSVSLGFARNSREIQTWCLDGDGSLLMHTGTLATIGKSNTSNFNHLVFNNFVHDSVGAQPTDIDVVNVTSLAASMGYKWTKSVDNKGDLGSALDEMSNTPGPKLLEIMIRPGFRSDLGRPTESPKELLTAFQSNLKGIHQSGKKSN